MLVVLEREDRTGHAGKVCHIYPAIFVKRLRIERGFTRGCREPKTKLTSPSSSQENRIPYIIPAASDTYSVLYIPAVRLLYTLFASDTTNLNTPRKHLLVCDGQKLIGPNFT